MSEVFKFGGDTKADFEELRAEDGGLVDPEAAKDLARQLVEEAKGDGFKGLDALATMFKKGEGEKVTLRKTGDSLSLNNKIEKARRLREKLSKAKSAPVVETPVEAENVVVEEKPIEVPAVEKPKTEVVPETPVAEKPQPEVAPKTPAVEKPRAQAKPAPVEKTPQPAKVVVQEKKKTTPKKENINPHRPEKHPHHNHEQVSRKENRPKRNFSNFNNDGNEMRDIENDARDRAEIEGWFKDLAREEKIKKEAEKRESELKQKIEAKLKASPKSEIKKGQPWWRKFIPFSFGGKNLPEIEDTPDRNKVNREEREELENN